MPTPRGFFTQLKAAVVPVVVHGVSMMVAILCLWGVELLFRATMGDDALFFGAVPVVYVIQLAEILVLAKFVIRAWKDLSNA